MNKNISWLCDQEAWTRYRTKIDLMEKQANSPEIEKDYKALCEHALIKNLLEELQDWPGQPMKRHNDAKLLLHKLVLLADVGIAADHSDMLKVIEKVIDHQSQDGPFQITGNIPTVFGGSGQDESIWMLCDAPLVSYALSQMGLRNNEALQRSIDYMLSLLKPNGWPCAASSNLGKNFKGPGKRTDPCPYTNLIMLKLLSSVPELHNSHEARTGAETLLDLWENRKGKKYFLFGMGTDFSKLKAPLIWFDILHVADVLSQFEFLKKDERLLEMIRIIKSKSDEHGRFKAESVYRSWKEWDFGQKKINSGWITFIVSRILKRVEL